MLQDLIIIILSSINVRNTNKHDLKTYLFILILYDNVSMELEGGGFTPWHKIHNSPSLFQFLWFVLIALYLLSLTFFGHFPISWFLLLICWSWWIIKDNSHFDFLISLCPFHWLFFLQSFTNPMILSILTWVYLLSKSFLLSE